MMTQINATTSNRKVLKSHAREALRDYSPVMTWLILDKDGNLYEIIEPQGQTYLNLADGDEEICRTGGFHKAHGDGAVRDDLGQKFKTQKAYLTYLLGKDDYDRIFIKSNKSSI